MPRRRNWSSNARELWYSYRRTLDRSGRPSSYTYDHLRGRPELFSAMLEQAMSDNDVDLYDDIGTHFDIFFRSGPHSGRYRRAVGPANYRAAVRELGHGEEVRRTSNDPGLLRDLAQDTAMSALEHITMHGHKEHPIGRMIQPFVGERVAGAIELAEDVYKKHKSHGKPNYPFKKQKTSREFIGNAFLPKKKKAQPITEPSNLFDVTQPAALTQNNSNMFRGATNRHTLRYTGGTPRTPRTIGRTTPRSRGTPGRVSTGRARRFGLRRVKGRRGRKRSRFSGLRTPGMKKSRRRLRTKRLRRTRVSKRLARKIKKVIKGGLPSGRHIQIEVKKFDPRVSNRINWVKEGFNDVTWNPALGLTGELFSPFEVLRKANELFMDKIPSRVNYECSTTLQGYYDMVGAANDNDGTSHNLWPQNSTDNWLGSIPKLEVTKQYQKTEIVNNTQRTYYMEIYEIQSKRNGSHAIIGDPFTQFCKETSELRSGGTSMAGTTNEPYISYVAPFPTLGAANADGGLVDLDTSGILSTGIANVESSAYPYRPEWLPGWNRAWKFKKTKIQLEPGQSYTHYMKGWTGHINYRKLFTASFGATTNLPESTTYQLNGVQRNMNRWIMWGIYTDLVCSTTTVSGSSATFIRAGRIDTLNSDGAFGLVIENTQVLKMKFPESLLFPSPKLTVSVPASGPASVVVDHDTAANTVAQGNKTIGVGTFGTGHYLQSSKRPRVLLYSGLDDRPFGTVASEVRLGRVDETNPNVVETTPGGLGLFSAL